MIEGISAITLVTHDMRRAVRFYRVLGLAMLYGGEEEGFTSFKVGSNFVNLIAQPAARQWSWWGRVVFYHSDVDGLYARLVAAGYRIEPPPRDCAAPCLAVELEIEFGRQRRGVVDGDRRSFR